MKNAVNSKNKKYTTLAWALAALVLAVAIPFNLIFSRLNINIDTTPDSLYTLTKTTTDYLDSLDEQNIVVDVYFLGELKDLEGELELLALYRTLLAYKEHPCFHLIDFDPDTNPEILRDINPNNFYNLSDYDFMFVYNGMVKRIPATLMYTYEYAEDSEGVQHVSSAEFRAENYFTGAMKSVVEGVEPTVCFLEGHGENTIDQYSKLVANLGNYNYAAESLNLINAEKVPEDCCIVIIPAPKRDISEEELDKLNAFLDKGGNVSLLMTPNLDDTTYTNLESLMLRFCIGMDYNRVYESDTARHASGNQFIYLVDMMPASEESEIDLTSALIEDTTIVPYMPAARSFYSIYGSNYTSCKIDTLIRTQATAVGEPYGGGQTDPVEVKGQELTLAMYSMDSIRNNAKLTVFGSAEFLTDESMKTDYYIAPLYLYLSTITWMYNSDVDMNIDNKQKTFDELPINSSETAMTMMVVFLAAPCVVLIAGAVVWLRRRDA